MAVLADMKIGYLQMAPLLGDPEGTIATLEPLLPRLAGSDLAVLPELCNSGYNFPHRDLAWKTAEPVDKSRFVDFLAGICRREGMTIATGFNERAGVRLYNSALLIDGSGVIGHYRKLHLFMNEPDFFTPGDLGLPVFDVMGVKVGLAICYDWMFPEVWRSLALKGAEVIAHPSNLVLPGLAQKAVPVHALVNGVYVVTANRVGTEGELTFTGLSTLAGPDGSVLHQGPAEGEEAFVVSIDPDNARDKGVTPRNDRLRDRRPEAYARPA